jgi:hypothetical protein
MTDGSDSLEKRDAIALCPEPIEDKGSHDIHQQLKILSE